MLKKQHLPPNIARLMLCVLCSSLLTGCWDRIEVEDRAVVLAMAIDPVKDDEQFQDEEVTHERGQEPRGGKIRVTMQIAVPGRLPLGPSDGGGQGGAGETKPVWVLTTEAYSLDDAFANMQQQVADQLFFGHLRVIVISEKLARRGLQDINETLRRQPEVRRTAWMLVTKEDPGRLMKISPQLERVPALYLYDMVDHGVLYGKLPRANLGIFWRSVSAPGQEGYVPMVESRKQEDVFTSGLAYFRGNRMVGKTEPFQIPLFMEVIGVENAGYSTLFPLPGKRGWVAYQGTSRRTEIQTFIRNGKPRIRVKIQVEGNLHEKIRDPRGNFDQETIRKLERIIARDLQMKVQDLIHETQQKGSDIFAFGEYVRSEYPDFWRRNVEPHRKGWERWFRKLPVDIQVRAKLRRIGSEAK
ncbi:spore germination protein KC [Kroppenstedtia sanguinis]|uniref:Ger(X)C family spore germination protein n=1 Tax=Kroppenstedtia sanguinis TaxID=1380684 RepID=A0ABW4C4R2_9BACL